MSPPPTLPIKSARRPWGRPGTLAALAINMAAGALQAAAIAWPQRALGWLLQPLAVALFVWTLEGTRPLAAAARGWVFGFTWLVASVWWLFISMHRYGELPAWMAALAVAALCAFLSLYLAMAAGAYARWRSGRTRWDALLFAAVWLLAELARAVLFTGFPWAASGYAHVDGLLRAWAPWVGVYGMGALAAALAAGAVLVLLRGPRRWRARLGWLVAVAGVTVLASSGVNRLNDGFTHGTGSLDVSLLQGNVPQDQKFVNEYLPLALEWHVRALQQAGGDLIVAPETAIPLLPEQLPAGLWDQLHEHFAKGSRHALVGVPLGSFEAGYTNSVVGLGPAGTGPPGGYRYDKHHLVPFGEFIPWGFRWFTDMMNIPLGDFRRGPLNAPSYPVGVQRVAPNICYEDLFGEDLAARFSDAATAPTMFANMSNIGWFGDTIAIDQHLNISRLRTLEFQRPMLRATNTGATAIIDHRGRVLQQLAPFTAGVLQGRVEGRDGLTPYARWAAWGGVWPLAAVAFAVVLAAARRARKGPDPAS